MRKKATQPEELKLGLCVQCGEPIVIHLQKGVPRHLYEGETFCSATCARAHFGTSYGPAVAKPSADTGA